MEIPNEDVVNYQVFPCPSCGYSRGIRENTHDYYNVKCEACGAIYEYKDWVISKAGVRAQTKQNEEDLVNHPSHYAKHYPLEVKEIIKMVVNHPACDSLTHYQAGCLKDELKYRLRAGFKNPDKIEEDIKKAMFYNEERQNG